jgi:hypothetical protein
MNDQPVGELEGELREVLVRAVNRIPRLKASDAAPPALANPISDRARRQAVE